MTIRRPAAEAEPLWTDLLTSLWTHVLSSVWRAGGSLLALAVLITGLSVAAPAAAITAEEATQVGGDMTRMREGAAQVAQRLEKVRASALAILAAAPTVGTELDKARIVITNGRAEREMASNALLACGVLAILLGLRWAWRRLTRRIREACIAGSLRARGAFGLALLDIGDWAVFSAGVWLAIRLYFDATDLQALVFMAILSSLVRWLLFWKFLQIALRPDLPAFRLFAMPDDTARRVARLFGAATLLGFVLIGVMPVFLRAGLPIPAGQVIVLLQGLPVALLCGLGVIAYHRGTPEPTRAQSALRVTGAIGVPLALLVWMGSVVALEFGIYHSLLYSLRIALIAYAIHALLELSATHLWWFRLAQHAISAGAVLALTILLSELWIVERFQWLTQAQWLPIRYSLETTSITLFVGFIGWRYLDLWTEERLRKASPGLAPGMDDDIAAEPASRLTTALPLVRVVSGVVILMAVVFLGMHQLGADLTALVAGAGVFGLALSFGSQALVRDIVAGIFYMADDAFRIGEYIDTGRLKGTVERVTLRSVRLRHQNGQVHTIPFGQLNAITNFSRDWQTVKFNLRLARDADIEKARKIVKRVGQELAQDAEFGPEFLLPLKMQGMAEIEDTALVVRLKFTVRPSNPSIVQRECLKRLHRALPAEGVEFASGAITVHAASPVPLALAGGGAAAAASSAASSAGAEAGVAPA